MNVCLDFTVNEMRDRHGGFGRYAFNLLEELLALPASSRKGLNFYALPKSNAPPVPAEKVLDRAILNEPMISPFQHRIQRRLFVGHHLRRGKIDLFHSIHPACQPLFSGCNVVATVHDIGELLFPEERHTMPARLLLQYAKWQTWLRLRRADHLIVISSTTAKDVTDLLHIEPTRMTVIPQGIDLKLYRPQASANELANIQTRFQLPPKWFITVGSDHFRKNQWRLYQAWCRIADSVEEGLVLVGYELYGDIFKRILADSRRRGLDHRVRWLQGVPDVDLPHLYRGATAFIQPSLFEGFSLTLLEAMACGVPVLASYNAIHQEVGGDAVFFFDPTSEKEIAQALTQIAQTPEEQMRLIPKGQKRANQFSWRATAQATLEVYKNLLAL